MRAVLMGVASAWLVLGLTGFRRKWPWRVADLTTVSTGTLSTAILSTTTPPTTTLPNASTESVRSIAGRVGDRNGRNGRRDTSRPESRVDVQRALPLTADLLLVAVSAGHSIHGAIEAVGRLGEGPVSEALGAAWERFCGGSRLVDELRELPKVVGDQVRPLCNTLIMGLASGAALEPALHRLADGERRRLRRRAEERVRRLPILLLGPLVVLVLPSFVVLAILPVILATARNAGF